MTLLNKRRFRGEQLKLHKVCTREEVLRLLDLATLEERRVRRDLIQWFKIRKGFVEVNMI